MIDPPPVIGSAKHKSDAIRQEPSRRLPLGWRLGMEVPMDAEFVTVKATDAIATITLGTEKRIYIDQETWPEARFIDGPISVCESMPKPVIAAISGTCLAGAFELTLSCDLRIAEDGDYQIGFPEPNFGLCPGAGGTQRLARTIGTPAALMHILMGVPLSPREAERRGLVHETVSGDALERAMEIARHLSSFTPESLAYIKRLVRSATETPLAQGLLHERRMFMKLCISDAALSRMRAYDEQDSDSPSRLT